MTSKQSKADSIPAATPAAQVEVGARQPKQITPPFRALGIPALAAATRSVPKKKPAEAPRDLPPFLRQPHNS
ncbi:hypothetical protein ACUSIJ_01200 [Pseudochelatococcus sp. B33]